MALCQWLPGLVALCLMHVGIAFCPFDTIFSILFFRLVSLIKSYTPQTWISDRLHTLNGGKLIGLSTCGSSW